MRHSIEQLRLVVEGGVGVERVRAVLALVEQGDAESGELLRRVGAKIPGSAGGLVRAAAFLVEGRISALARAAREDPDLLRGSLLPASHLPTPPGELSELFSLWIEAVRRSVSSEGVTAHRALLGEIAEVAFRAHGQGADARRLLGDDNAYFLDALSSELPGTTDFLAARSMTWLLGLLARDDDGARSAIERARARFHEPSFLADCDAILAGAWPALRERAKEGSADHSERSRGLGARPPK